MTLLKKFFYPLSFGCQGKSFEIWPFCGNQLFEHPILTHFWQFLSLVKNECVSRKWHNSMIICPSDLGQGSKFLLIRYLKLFLWHPKDLVSRKNVLGEQNCFEKACIFFNTLYSNLICLNLISSFILNFENFWIVHFIFKSNQIKTKEKLNEFSSLGTA